MAAAVAAAEAVAHNPLAPPGRVVDPFPPSPPPQTAGSTATRQAAKFMVPLVEFRNTF